MEFSPFPCTSSVKKKTFTSDESTLQTPLVINSKKGIICQTVGVGISKHGMSQQSIKTTFKSLLLYNMHSTIIKGVVHLIPKS